MWFTFGDTLTFLITCIIVISLYIKWCNQYWKRKNLDCLEVKSSGEQRGIYYKNVYNEMKSRGWKHGGSYQFIQPLYIPIDLDILKNIMAKDFQHFTDRGIYYNEKDDPLSAHLFNLDGSKWRNLRAKLTPTFTSGKLKSMFQTLLDCEVNLQKKIKFEYEKNAPIDIKEALSCFTTDVIGSCAFGLECKTFENDKSPFRTYGKKVFERDFKRQTLRTFATVFPNVAKMLSISIVPKDMNDFFMSIVEDTVSYRERNNVQRKDFLQLLIDLKNEENGLTIQEIAAQSFVFFAAGFETSSTTMTFALYELAKNLKIQDRLRAEIKSVLSRHDKITYEAVQEMKFLSQVIDESLRKYPPAALIPRRCVQNYKVPETNVTIEKDVIVIIPILGIHHDPEYYPDPEKFDPDRFTEENKKTRHGYAHIPFGEGPRNCIGLRFGLMQAKVGLVSLLKNYKFTVNQKTREPLQMKPSSIVLAAEGDIWLNAHKD